MAAYNLFNQSMAVNCISTNYTVNILVSPNPLFFVFLTKLAQFQTHAQCQSRMWVFLAMNFAAVAETDRC